MRRVNLADAKGDDLGRLVIGNAQTAPSGSRSANTYVRIPDEAQSWLAQGVFLIDRNPAEWLDKELLVMVRERIKSVDIVQADGSALTAGTLTINVPNAPAAGAAQSNDGGQLRALSGVSDWQLYCYRGNAWSNCQSSADAGQPIPDGMRLVLAFAEGSGFSGTVTRDVAIAP